MPVYASPTMRPVDQPLFGAPLLEKSSSHGLASTREVVFSGRAAVLLRASLLEELALRFGQPGAMHGLDYLIDHEYASRKTPYLVCLFAEGHAPQLLGAVLLFEHRVGRWNTGLFSTGDRFGVRTVIGPEHLRVSIAARACSALLRQRPGMVLASFKQEPTATVSTAAEDSTPTIVPGCLWATQTRLVQDHLALEDTVDKTLARLGKRTRTHLRYYRRRLQDAVPCDFLPDVSSLIDPQDVALLEQLNRGALEPLAQEIFNLQFRSAAQATDGFVSGLRSRQGQWLAVAGGWRQGGTTWVQWQTNAAGHPSLSIGTALRLFLIEQEVERGTRSLAFHGGTPHSMGHAFPSERVVDLIARRGLLPTMLTGVLPMMGRLLPPLASRGNFLADALRAPGLRWSQELPRQNDLGGLL